MSFFDSILNILRFNKKNWRAVVLCIFTATVFWFFNALNKSYSTTVSFPLVFDYDEERFIPVIPLPNSVRLNVSGIGWNLFRRSAGLKVPPLVIPLERPAEVKKIVGSTLPAFFANQLADFQINFVMTDTLLLAIEPIAKRRVKVTIDLPPTFLKDNYTIVSPIRIAPDSISIEGPVKLITGLSDPVYLKISQRDIDENFNEAVEVKFLNDGLIKRAPPTVDVSFDVDKLIGVTDSVSLKVINAPRQSWPFIERKKLLCQIAIPQRAYESYNPDSIKAVVDLKDFVKGERKVLPQLIGLPPFAEVLRLDSIVIKF